MYLCFMYSRRLYAKIVGGAVLIVLLSLIGSWLLITRLSFFLSFVCLLFILLITLFIIRLATRLNYKLSVFFEAMRNEDTTQHFPANPDDPFTNALYADMNHILRQLGDKHIEIEEKSLYCESILRVMTHEIRNSVTPIASLSADLLKHLDRTSISRQREGLEVINSQVKNLTAFLDSYHRLTHLPEPEYKTVSVPALFTKLERLLQAEPRSERVVYCDGKADKSTGKELQVYGDANLLTLALINLIRNALQAVEGQEDGIVRVDTCAGATGHLLITITDNGPGDSSRTVVCNLYSFLFHQIRRKRYRPADFPTYHAIAWRPTFRLIHTECPDRVSDGVLISQFEILIYRRNTFIHPFRHGGILQVVVEELEHAFLEIDPVCQTHRPVRFAGIVEQPRRFLQAFKGNEVFDSLIPGYMPVCIVVHDQDRSGHLIHIEQGRVFNVLQRHFPDIAPYATLPVFILHGTV